VIFVSVHGRPAPKGSRIYGRTKTGKAFTRPASNYEKGWVADVKAATQIAMRHHEQPPQPYVVDLSFRLHAPARNRREMPWWPTRHDLDKLVRAAIDGLVLGGAIEDDRHVVRLTASKAYVDADVPEGVDAQISTALVPAGV
jgi:Holliday junction resolvase RusA-like endonuclease